MVLLHGPGGYGAMWQQLIPGLTSTHRVVAPDLPGHGTSTVGDGRLDAGRVISWLGELIEHTCPTPPILVGQLVGGAIAARFAADYGDRLERLVLVVPLGLAPFEPSPAYGAALTGFLAHPSEETHDDLWQHCVFDLDALQREPAARWELMKAYNLDRAPTVSDALQALMEQLGFPAIPETVLTRIAAPTSLIWGPPRFHRSALRRRSSEHALRLAAPRDRERRQRAGNRSAGRVSAGASHRPRSCHPKAGRDMTPGVLDVASARASTPRSRESSSTTSRTGCTCTGRVLNPSCRWSRNSICRRSRLRQRNERVDLGRSSVRSASRLFISWYSMSRGINEREKSDEKAAWRQGALRRIRGGQKCQSRERRPR
jgi:pimeloyl-ACP methyl ester carboxylesterase